MGEAALDVYGHGGPWTEEEFLALPETAGERIELLDGSLLVSPAAGSFHQEVAFWLTWVLYNAAPAELKALEAVNVRVRPSQILIPDVVVTSELENAAVLPAEAIHLVAEVVSPPSVAHDRITKPALYAAAGIPTYLRVELGGQKAPEVFAFELRAGAYHEVARANADELLRLDKPFSVELTPGTLLKRRA